MKRGLLLVFWAVLGIISAPSRTAAQLATVPIPGGTFIDLFHFQCTWNPVTSGYDGPCDPGLGVFVQGTDGNLYGITGTIGTPTIFQTTPAGVVTELTRFPGEMCNQDGVCSTYGLTLGPDGNFYGVTQYGGTAVDNGTVFRMIPSGQVTTLHEFNGLSGDNADGANPIAPPVLGDDGYLYGTATNFGYKISISDGCSAQIAPICDFHTLTSSIPVTIQPSPLLLANDGNFYGVSWNPAGIAPYGLVYRMTPDGSVTNVFTFPSQFDSTLGTLRFPQGARPYGALVQGADGNLYGTNTQGGPYTAFDAQGNVIYCSECGTIFQLNPAGVLGWDYFLSPNPDPNSAGDNVPYPGLVAASDGNFYGAVTATDTLFRITSDGSYTPLYVLNTGLPCNEYGTRPYTTPIQATTGLIYGMTNQGGANFGCNGFFDGTLYGLDLNLPPFIATIQPSGSAGQIVGILGQGFSSTSNVSFNGLDASFNVISDTYLTAAVPAGATTGPLTVTEGGSTLTTKRNFRILESSGPSATSTSLTSSLNPSTFGQSVTFTATVTSQNGAPTGSVTFSDGNTTLGSGTVNAGQAAISTSALTVGSHSITAAYGGDSNYSASSSTAIMQTVNQATATISLSNIPGNAVFNGSFTPTFSYTGDGVPSVGSNTAATCTVSGNVVHFVGAGSCTLTAHATAGTNYAAITGNPQSFTIAQLQPTISINNIPVGAQYGGRFTPIYFYAGDGTTSTTSSTSATCTVSGGVVNFVGIGTCTLTARATATANSAAATGGSQSFSITQARPTISINNIPASAVYGGNFTLTYTYSGNGKTSTTSSTTNTCTVSGKGVVSFVAAGTCTLIAHAAATTNFAAATGNPQSFTIAPATTKISIKNIPNTAKKGGSFTPTYVYVGDGTPSTISNTPATCAVSGSIVKFVASGTCSLTAQATAGMNYAVTTGSAQTFTIK